MRASAWLIFLLLASPAVACAGGTLPLISIVEGQQTSGWWVTDPAGPLSEIERGISARVGPELGVIDPSASAKSPRVSRIYRVPQLSPQNAANLAGLYGADKALVGTGTYRPVTSTGRLGLVGVELVVELRWLAVPSGAVLAQAQVRGAGWGTTAREARDQARDKVVVDLAALLTDVSRNLSARVGVDRSEPYVVVRGVWDAAAGRALEKALGAAPGVSSVRLAWVAEGVLAWDLNPKSQEDGAWVAKVVSTLEASPPDGMAVTVTPAGLEVRRSAKIDKESEQ
jgi:hypothetical protein